MAIAEQEAASYGLPPAVVNEVLLAQSYVQLLTYPLWLLFCYSARVKFGNSNHVASKTVTTYCGALYILDVIRLAQGKAKRCSVDRIHARTRGKLFFSTPAWFLPALTMFPQLASSLLLKR